MVAAGPAADLPAAGLPTERQSAHEYRRQFGGRPTPAPAPASTLAASAPAPAAAPAARPRMETVMLAATHRPAAGKSSGAMAADQAAPRKSLSMGALRAQQRSRLADDGEQCARRSRRARAWRGGEGFKPDRRPGLVAAAETEPLMAAHDHDVDDLRGEEKIREDNASKEDGTRIRWVVRLTGCAARAFFGA